MFNYNTATILPASRATTGVLGAANQATFDTTNTDWIAFQLGGTWTGTVNVQTSSDNGTTWNNIYVIKGDDASINPAATSNGWWFGNSIGSLTRLQFTAGTGTVQLLGGTTDVQNAPNGVGGPNSPSSNVTNTPINGSLYTALTTASTNGALIKGSAGNLTVLALSNTTATAVYVKLYNKSASAPVVGTDAPMITVSVLANQTVIQEFGDEGLRFNVGLGIAVTGAAADSDTTASVAGMRVAVGYS